MQWEELKYRLGRCEHEPAFIYAADVSLFVEYSAYGFNPGITPEMFRDALVPEPGWIRNRPELLKDAWPGAAVTSQDDLLRLALLSANHARALG